MQSQYVHENSICVKHVLLENDLKSNIGDIKSEIWGASSVGTALYIKKIPWIGVLWHKMHLGS